MQTAISKNEKYVCVRECYTYNKRFKVGDVFPQEWLDQDYYPNQHFMPASDAGRFLDMKKSSGSRPVMCSGDDSRSTKEMIEALAKHTNVNPKWTRAEIWAKVREYETATAKTGAQPERLPRNKGSN